MKHRLLPALLLCLGSFFSFGQRIVLFGPPSAACVGTEAPIPFSSTLTFQPGNTFKVQFRTNSGLGTPREAPVRPDGPVLRVPFPDPRSLGFSANEAGFSYQYRIVSTDPVAESEWIYLQFRYLPQLTSVEATPGVVNPDEGTPVRFTGTGTGPVTVVFTDSSRVMLSPSFSSNLTFQTTASVYGSRSGTFTVASVRNECGVGEGGASFRVNVNAFSLRTTSVSPATVCEGGTLLVGMTKQGGEFGSGNAYKIQLTPVNPGSGFPIPATLTLDATREGNSLRTTVPKNSVLDAGRDYFVRILTTQPELVSPVASRVVRLMPEPSVELSTASFTTDFESTVYLEARFRGVGPYRAELSDGMVISSGDTYSGSTSASVGVRMQRTTDFRITSAQSGCEAPLVIKPITTRIEVRPGAVLDSLPQTFVCEGQAVTARLRTNQSVPANLTVRLRQTRFSPTYQIMNWSVPARLDGTLLTFTLPSVGPLDVTNTSNPSTSYEIWVDIPGVPLNSRSLQIYSRPTIALPTGSPTYYHYSSDNTVDLRLNAGGGEPYTVLFDNGSSSAFTYSLRLPIFQSTTYRVRRISNACGQTDVDLSATVTVPLATGILLSPVRPELCQGDSVTVRYQAFGNYGSGNQFRVQVQKNFGEWTTIASLTTANGAVTIRPDEGNYTLRVASSDPQFFSNGATFRVRNTPTLRLTPTSNPPLVLGDGVSVSTTVTGGEPYTLVLSNGTQDLTYRGYVGSVYLVPPASGTYRVKSIANACGTGTASGEAVVEVQPVRLEFTSFSDQEVCQGSTLAVPVVVRGRPTAATRYRLELINPTDPSRVLATFEETALPVLKAALPANLAPGRYALRATSTNPASASNPSANINVAAPPTATLTAEDGSGTVTTESTAALKLTLTGTPRYQVLFSDNVESSFGDNTSYRYVTPTRAATYSLSRVYNACGYGTVTGQVTVRVKPTLVVFRTGSETACPGRVLRLRLDARGDYEAGNLFRYELLNGTRLVARLDSGRATQGEYRLTLPANLPGGNYLVRVTSTQPVVTQQFSLFVNTVPTVTLSGTATVNPGRSAFLRLANTNGSAGPVQYTLSSLVSGQWEPFQTNPFNLAVSPAATTTYTLLAASNACGTGTVGGTATVTVNPAAERTVDLTTVFVSDRLCTGDTTQVTFETKGTFSPGNRFTVQLSDSTGANFIDLATLGSASPLRAVIPGSTPRGSGYRLRVVASEAGTQSGTSPYAYVMRQKATAAFDTDVLTYLPGKPVKALVRFTGDSPWTYTIGTDAGSFSRSAGRNPDTLTLQPASPTLFYRLSAVRNECGSGTIGSPATLKVELITALEPTAPTLRVFPNPTAQRLRIEGLSAPTELRLLTPGGQLLRRVRHAPDGTELDLSALPAGLYLLQVNRETGPVTYRVVKE